jgi:hypothetical protein
MRYVLVAIAAAVVTAAIVIPGSRRAGQPAASAPSEATVQQLMEGLIDPAARGIFESVGVIAGPSGTVERRPTTDEEWAAVSRHAAILAEGADLLKVPGRRVSDDTGEVEADAPEHSADRIAALMRENQPQWVQSAEALAAVARRAREAVQARSVDGLYTVGGDLEEACEACHQAFWYNPPAGTRIRR